jgi:hypothetical protein
MRLELSLSSLLSVGVVSGEIHITSSDFLVNSSHLHGL